MKRFLGFGIVILTLAALASGPVSAQDNSEATISALQTQVAELEATVDARGEKINAQRTQIADLKGRVSDLEGQVPPTPTAAPVLTGKDAYPYVGDPLEIFTRPFNHFGEKMSFCGTVGYIEVGKPGDKYVLGDTVSTGWNTVVQIAVDGYDARFVAGFDGDTTGIFEDSHVCVWGELVDTFTGTNTFGGTIVNPLFDAEYLELG